MPVVRQQQPPPHSQPPQGAAHPAGQQHRAGRPPVRPDAPVVTHHGNLYALGYVGNAYVIWDRKSPSSGPIQRFPRTPDGWKAAWRQFQAMEGAAQGRTTGPTHPQWQVVIPGRRHTNASLVMALLSLFPVLGLAFGGIGIALGAHATKRGDRRGSTAVAANVIGLILDVIFIVAIAANQA